MERNPIYQDSKKTLVVWRPGFLEKLWGSPQNQDRKNWYAISIGVQKIELWKC